MKQVAILPDVLDHIVIDRSGKDPRYIAVSHTKKYMQISPRAYTLLEKVHAGHSFTAIAQDLNRGRERTVAPEEVQKAYEQICTKISKIESEKETKDRSFWFKLPVISASNVQEIASACTFMFHPLVALVALSSIGLLATYAIVSGLTTHVSANPPFMIIPAYLLFLLSLFAHEFGHGSACLKGGVEPSEIGVAVYLFFPVFYSDVSASWQLTRWQKVRVDVAGVYFQLCVGGIYLLLFIVTREALFQWAILMLLSSCLLSINPFLKFDGYWVLTDMLGVSNLFKQPMYLLGYFYQTRIQKRQQTLRWSPGVCIVILLYSAGKIAFWGYLLLAFLPALYKAIALYPAQIENMLAHLSQYGTHLLLTDLQILAANGIIVVLYGGGIYRICTPWIKQLFVRKVVPDTLVQ